MPFPIFWTKENLNKLTSLYESGLSMKEVGFHFNKSVWAINSIMRRHNITRRIATITRINQFANKPLSFHPITNLSQKEKELKIAGLMLYWGEGAKVNASGIDFANSDPHMITLFLKFLRKIYLPEEKRLRAYLYTFSKTNIKDQINYWSVITNIPVNQFSRPYIRFSQDLKHDKMPHGLIHIRYYDKKLLSCLMSDLHELIKSWGTQAVNEV